MVNVRNAIDFALNRIPEIDPGQLYTAGHSSAGVQALLLAENDTRIKGCIAYAPVVDLRAHVSELLPTYRQAIKDFDVLLKLASPREHEDDLRCPVFLFHALDDNVVPVMESTSLADRLQRRGQFVELKTVSNGGHYDAMISQGIPQGIAWLQDLSGLNRSPATPNIAGGNDKPGGSQTSSNDAVAEAENPFASVPHRTGTQDNIASKIKKLMGDSSKTSTSDLVTEEPGETKQSDSDTVASDESESSDENPFVSSPPRSSGGSKSAAVMTQPAPSTTDHQTTPGPAPSAGNPELTKLLDKIRNGDAFAKRDALQTLSSMEPPASKRDEMRESVAKVLNSIATGNDHFSQQARLRRWAHGETKAASMSC